MHWIAAVIISPHPKPLHCKWRSLSFLCLFAACHNNVETGKFVKLSGQTLRKAMSACMQVTVMSWTAVLLSATILQMPHVLLAASDAFQMMTHTGLLMSRYNPSMPSSNHLFHLSPNTPATQPPTPTSHHLPGRLRPQLQHSVNCQTGLSPAVCTQLLHSSACEASAPVLPEWDIFQIHSIK